MYKVLFYVNDVPRETNDDDTAPPKTFYFTAKSPTIKFSRLHNYFMN